MQDWEEALDLGDELTWTPLRVVPPDPWVGHIPFAFWLTKALRPDTLVELGTHSGNSYFAFCQAMATLHPAGRAYAVDTWRGDEHAGRYGEEVFASVSAFNAEHFRQFSTLLRATFDDARSYFPEHVVDLLHIDGMHNYDAVKHDFENWLPTLSSRSVVLFHDTNVRERDFGVWRLWQELGERFPSFEFSHSNGLGVLGVGPDQSPRLRALFELAGESDKAASFRRRISARGEAFQRQVELQGLQAQLQDATDQAQSLTGRIEKLTHRVDAVAKANEVAQAGIAQAGESARAEIAWRDMLLSAREEVIHAKQALAAELGDRVAAYAASLEARDSLITARDGLAAQLSADLRALAEQLKAAEGRIGQMANERDAVAAALQEAIAGQAVVAQTYVRSTSWRITRPLRVAVRLARGGPALPPPAAPAVAALVAPPPPVAPEPTPEIADVTSVTPLKAAVRTLFQARLDAFLSSPEMLQLPRSEQPEVSIILVLYNQAELTFACLASITETLRARSPDAEIVIVDNGSTDATGALLDRLRGATIIRNTANLHFLKAVNQATRSARGEAILLLNNDAQLLPGAVASALRTLRSAPDIGAVGGRIILPDGTLQEAGSIVWRDGACSGYGRSQDPNGPDYMFQRDVDYCSGAFLLTDAALWRELDGFDERFAPAYYEETDYCLRLWEAGYRVVFDPDASIMHYEFGSSTKSGEALALQAANHKVFAAQHADWLAGQFPASPQNVLAARTARSDAKRVLVLEDRVPKMELGSGYPRANRLVHELVEAGAQVAFFPMNRHSETWHGVRRALDKRVEVLIAAVGSQIRPYLAARRGHFDAILVCRPPNMDVFQGAVDFDRDLIGDARVIYDAEALFVTRQLQKLEAEGRPAKAPERRRMIAGEVSLTRLADAVISVSSAEQATMEDYGARQAHLLGHALEDQPIAAGFSERDQVVFLGAIQTDDLPNADAVRWFAGDILPRVRQVVGQGLRLTVIGNAQAPSVVALDGDTVDLVGMVDELPPALARAKVFVVPTRFAAGIPHKAHQAAMLGIPMVVTELIAQQLGWENEVELLVASEPRAFADAVARLYQDRDLWETIRRNALSRAQIECAPEAFTATVRRILADIPLVHRRPEPGPAAKAGPPPPVAEPPTSRPAETDFSVAVPFGFAPLQAQAPRLAVMCHLFHPEMAREVLFYLRNIPTPADLFLSTDTAKKRALLQATFAGWDNGRVEFRVTPNRGRDIAPKLVGFADRYEGYDLVLHLHSKKSDHAVFLTPWRSFLFENLLGSPSVVASILDAFARLPDLGMVAPQHYEAVRRWLGWNGNFGQAHALAKRMGLALSPDRALDFPSGSMFWARPAALRPLLDLDLTFEDFPEESTQVDHTTAHAIERLYFYACERSGHSWMKVAQPALYHHSSTIVEVATPAALSRFAAEHGVVLSGPSPIPVRPEPAPMQTRVAPGMASRLAGRAL